MSNVKCPYEPNMYCPHPTPMCKAAGGIAYPAIACRYDKSRAEETKDWTGGSQAEVSPPQWRAETESLLQTEAAGNLLNEALKEPDKFDLFRDRVTSLLDRWDKARKHPKLITPERAIRGFMSEVDDEFTRYLIRGENIE